MMMKPSKLVAFVALIFSVNLTQAFVTQQPSFINRPTTRLALFATTNRRALLASLAVAASTPALSHAAAAIPPLPSPTMGPLVTGAAVTFGLQFTAFCVAAALQTEVFYDVLGGVNYLMLAALGFGSSNASSVLLKCMTGLFVVSRGWLLVFLAWRAHSRKGDSRFDGVKDNPPVFFVYWMVQACWVYLVSMPLLVVQSEAALATVTTTASLTIAQLSLLLGFAGGIVMEIMSDIQKTLWIQRGRKGGFCTDGWWKYSRHPNYAGEILQWWCAALLAVVSWSGSSSSSSHLLPWISLVSPLFTMQILLTMSGTGVWNAEGKNLKRYYEKADVRKRYIQYRKTTPPVFPVPGYGILPLSVKRTLCFEWERYEYKDKNK